MNDRVALSPSLSASGSQPSPRPSGLEAATRATDTGAKHAKQSQFPPLDRGRDGHQRPHGSDPAKQSQFPQENGVHPPVAVSRPQGFPALRLPPEPQTWGQSCETKPIHTGHQEQVSALWKKSYDESGRQRGRKNKANFPGGTRMGENLQRRGAQSLEAMMRNKANSARTDGNRRGRRRSLYGG